MELHALVLERLAVHALRGATRSKLAALPGSWTERINDFTYARSSAVGSHRSACAFLVASYRDAAEGEQGLARSEGADEAGIEA